MKKLLLLASLTSVMIGCASVTPADKSKSDEAKKLAQPVDGTSVIYIYTDRNTDTVSANDVYVNNQCIGRLNQKSFAYVNVSPGLHQVGMESYQGINEIAVETKANEITYINAVSHAGFSYTPELVEAKDIEKAKTAIAKYPLVKFGACGK